jgi:hypothetical protein
MRRTLRRHARGRNIKAADVANSAKAAKLVEPETQMDAQNWGSAGSAGEAN